MSTKSLRAVLLERAGRARALDPDDAFDTICEHLKDDPSSIEELCPGYRLVRKKVERKEQIKRMSEASVAARQDAARERYSVIIPIITDALKANPAITLRELAEYLDQSGIKPTRSDKWSPASVQFIMRKAGIANEPSEA